MSYRLINANSIVFNSDGFITAENIEKMPCIYADLPNGMDGEHYVLEQEPCDDCRNCKKWDDCECGRKGHINGTSIGYSIGECKDFRAL